MRLAYDEGVAFRKDMHRFKTADWNRLDKEMRLVVLACSGANDGRLGVRHRVGSGSVGEAQRDITDLVK
jgi:hypothetical protein